MKTIHKRAVRKYWSVGVIGFAALLLPLGVSAQTTRILKGTDTITWDRTTEVWYESPESDIPTTGGYFEDGDMLISSQYFTGETINFGARIIVSNVAFDLSHDLLLQNSAENYGLNVGVSAVKKGKGVLTLNMTGDGSDKGNCWKANWDILGGTVKTNPNNTYGFINSLSSAYQPFTVTVRDSACLWLYGRTSSGYGTYDATNEGNVGLNAVVEKGGTLKVGDADGNRHSQTIRSLTLAGGALDLGTCKADEFVGLTGILKIIDKLYFAKADGVTTPYAVANPASETSRILFAGTKLTEIGVDDVTEDDVADLVFSQAIVDGTKDNQRIGFRKTGAGTMVLDNTANAFSGDVVIDGGVLRAGSGDGGYAVNTLGSHTTNARTITINDGGTLLLPNRFQLVPSIAYENTPGKTAIRVCTGGKLVQGTTGRGVNVYGDLWLDGGTFQSTAGQWGVGNGMVAGTFRFSGEAPYVFDGDALNCQLVLNGSPSTVFDVADITKDGAADVTFERSFAVANDLCDKVSESPTRYLPKDGYAFGFVKRGAGTLRLAFAYVTQSESGLGEVCGGDAVVEAGTLQVDNTVLAKEDANVRFVVKDGASLSGSGSVRNVVIEQGGGFAGTVGQSAPLKVLGTVTLPTAGTISVTAPPAVDPAAIRLDVAQIDGAVAGSSDLSGWAVRVNGTVLKDLKVVLRDGVVRVGPNKGLVVTVR